MVNLMCANASKANKYKRGFFRKKLSPNSCPDMPMSSSQKEFRKLEKKIRTKEQRYRDTGDKAYLRARDIAQDELDEELSRKKPFSTKKQEESAAKTRVKKTAVSDEQLFNEAKRYNRYVKQEALRAQEHEMIKREKLKGIRAVAMENLIEKRNVKTENKNPSLKDKKNKHAEQKRKWGIYRDLFEIEYVKENKENTSIRNQGEIQRLAQTNYEQELKIQHLENTITGWQEMLQSHQVDGDDSSEFVREMMEAKTKDVRDSYPTVLNILDIWTKKIEGIEGIEGIEEIEEIEEIEDL
jgi:hypothetical protein